MDNLLYKTCYNSPVGCLTLASDGESLVGLWIEGQKYFADIKDVDFLQNDELEIFEQVKSWLDRYFAGEQPEIAELPLSPRGNLFRQSVWNILKTIPYGEVMSYCDIAKKVAEARGIKSMSAQAVGGAVGHNPISIIIPCHRVIGKNGSLTGYAGGLEIKEKLLRHEGMLITT
ncbi:MAG: methylated-DNA--[protein]-cysteine S-methyltransferase [Muribaculaceae bacterium]|nr:methylated-DNA--[protein]-cysteine S-methyltransferase [Muribaculaceae bacterium]